jgi:hypothetical protein
VDDEVNDEPVRGGSADRGPDFGIVMFVGRHVPGERVAHVTLPIFGYNHHY